TGQAQTTDDSFAGTVSSDNIVRALNAAGKSWRAYMEAFPSGGDTGGDVWAFLKQHSPLFYLSDLLSSAPIAPNVVPLPQLAADANAGMLPSFAFVVPDAENDAHSCPANAATCPDSDKLVRADNWLRTNIDPLINSPSFSNGALIITWDEGDNS